MLLILFQNVLLDEPSSGFKVKQHQRASIIASDNDRSVKQSKTVSISVRDLDDLGKEWKIWHRADNNPHADVYRRMAATSQNFEIHQNDRWFRTVCFIYSTMICSVERNKTGRPLLLPLVCNSSDLSMYTDNFDTLKSYRTCRRRSLTSSFSKSINQTA